MQCSATTGACCRSTPVSSSSGGESARTNGLALRVAFERLVWSEHRAWHWMALAGGNMGAVTDPRRQFAPSAERNKEPILQVLKQHLPATPKKGAVVLEVASGTGQHTAHFATHLPAFAWQPTEYAGCPGPTAPPQLLDTIMQSLVAYTEELPNVLPPVALDASSATWCDDSVGPTAAHDFVGVLAVNVLHISPFAVTEGLMAGAGRLLAEGGMLMVYGPFKKGGVARPESNAKFDETLRGQNAEWGLRDVEAVQALAEQAGFLTVETVDMPANNTMLVFRRK